MKKGYFKVRFYAVVFVMCCLFCALCASFILNSAPTYDENVHIAAGYSYWKTGEIYLNRNDHPPLVKKISAIPLLFRKLNFSVQHPSWQRNLQYDFADLFVYWNNVKADVIVNSGRFVIVGFGVLLGLLVFMWSCELHGKLIGLLTAAMCLFNPNIIANSSLITTDIGVAVGFFASLYMLYRYTRSPSSLVSFLGGAAVGVSLTSKFSGILILPAGALILGYCIFKGRFTASKSCVFKHIIMFLAGLLVVFMFCYKSSQLYIYWAGLRRLFGLTGEGFSSFLCGEYSTTGWRHYFITAFSLKNPEVFVLLIPAGIIFYIFKSFKSKKLSDEVIFLFFPALFFFSAASFSKFQIGIRHILPVFPLLMVWSGGAFKSIKSKKLRVVSVVLFFSLYAIGSMGSRGKFLSYFNHFAGGPENGYKYLVDSNFDWGQGLKNLGKYLNGIGVQNIYMSYFGTADPNYYGIHYVPVGFISTLKRQGDAVDISSEKIKLIAISATNLQANYYLDKTVFNYFKTKKPLAVIDYTIFLYDITADLGANMSLLELFKSLNDSVQIAVQKRIIEQINASPKQQLH